MNKTLKDNELDTKYLEGEIENWETEGIHTKEFETIKSMLSKEEYKNWECIYTITKNAEEDLTDEYVKLFNTILDYDSEIVINEYFDSAIVLYEETKGLFICKEDFNTSEFRITLYKYQ